MCELGSSLVNAKGEEGDLIFYQGSQQLKSVAKETV